MWHMIPQRAKFPSLGLTIPTYTRRQLRHITLYDETNTFTKKEHVANFVILTAKSLAAPPGNFRFYPMVYGHFLCEKSSGNFPLKLKRGGKVPELISYVLERASGARGGRRGVNQLLS